MAQIISHADTDASFVPLKSPVDAIIARLARNFTPEQVKAAFDAANEIPTPASDRGSAGTAHTTPRGVRGRGGADPTRLPAWAPPPFI